MVACLVVVACATPKDPTRDLPTSIRGEVLEYIVHVGRDLPIVLPDHDSLAIAAALGADVKDVTYISGHAGRSGYRSDIYVIEGVASGDLLPKVVESQTSGLEHKTASIDGHDVLFTIRPEHPNAEDCVPCFVAIGDAVMMIHAGSQEAREAIEQLP